MTDDGVFDAKIAATYDRIHGDGTSPQEQRTAKALLDLATDGTALEFAIGTGRIAIPMHALGAKICGIELSSAMVAELRKKPGGAQMEVAIGDMTTTGMNRTVSLVFLIFNTIDNLTTQEAQLACFQNAAAHLAPGGRFVIETLVPPIQKLTFGETKRAFARSDTNWGMDEFDVVTQNYASHHLHLEGGAVTKVTVPFRYAWPSELDLMARVNGMTLEHRWSGWDKSPFTNTSTSHISVWRMAD